MRILCEISSLSAIAASRNRNGSHSERYLILNEVRREWAGSCVFAEARVLMFRFQREETLDQNSGNALRESAQRAARDWRRWCGRGRETIVRDRELRARPR